MTKKEANLFFHVPDGEEIDIFWEDHFFKSKQYFINHVPIPKVWHSKLRRLDKEYKAYLVLTNQEYIKTTDNSTLETLELSDDFIIAYKQLEEQRKNHKLFVLNAPDPYQLNIVIAQWLNDEVNYAMHWSCEESKYFLVEVIQSKAPDPMEWLEDLENLKNMLKTTSLKILKQSFNKLPEEIKKEVKRLTLLAEN